MTTAGIVLAGGRSTRMGTPKAALDWHGTPLLAHVAAALTAALDGAPVVVVRAPGLALPPLPAGVRVAEDPVEGRGPLQGLIAGLDALPDGAGAAVVVATDQPFAAAVVPRLLAAAQPADDAVAFAGQPLGALYRRRVRDIAATRLAAEQGSLRGLLAAVATRQLSLDAAARTALRSLDTPEAYAAARRLRP